MPKKVKYRKIQRGRLKGMSKGARTLLFGNYGLMVTEPAFITSRQIESVRVTVARKLKEIGTAYLRMFPDKPMSKKPAGTRMGKGKGAPELWVFAAKRGRIILEISGTFSIESAKEILKAASYKLPMKTRFIAKEQTIN